MIRDYLMASFSKSLRRYLMVTFTSGLMFTKSYGQTFTYDSFNLPAVTPSVQFYDLGSLPTQPPAATTYTNYSVTVNWTSVSGFPYSNEARLRIVNSSAQTTTYATSAIATSGALNSEDPTTLTWAGTLSTSYTSGDALSIGALQTYGGSTANWSSVTVTLSNAAPPTPPPSTFTLLGSSLTTTLTAGEVKWYKFTVATSGNYSFDTEGTVLTGGSTSNDTELGLYRSNGNLVAEDDDSGTGNLSLLSNLALTPGDYYLAVGGYDTSYGASFGAISTSTAAGSLVVNGIMAVPEPTFLGLAGLAVTGLAIRRSRVTGK